MNTNGIQTRIVFSGIGTKGDVLPLLALATEMKRRGHAVHLLANDAFGGVAQRHGVGFTAVTAEQKNNLISSEENLNQHVMPSYEPTFEYFRQQMQHPGPLVVVNLDEFSASNVMAELYGLPLCRIQLAPWRIRSLIRPPWPFREEIAGRMLSRAFHKYTLPALYGHQERCVTFVRALNPRRERVGLPPAQSTLDIDAHITLRLGFFPEWYAKPEADWPAEFQLVGFPLAKSRGVLPAELEAFIEREGKPLVFTPGTGVVNVQRFFEDARRCCEALNLPGVFLSPHLSLASSDFGPRIRHYGFLDLDLMLREAALLIHHGGIGTTARALQAGVPQIIRPAMYDQFDNGDRVRLLGVGNMLLPDHYSPEKLIDLVRELTTSAQVKANLQRFREELAGTDAILLAADALERAVRQREARRHLLAAERLRAAS